MIDRAASLQPARAPKQQIPLAPCKGRGWFPAHEEDRLCLPTGSVGSILGKATSTTDFWNTVKQTNKQKVAVALVVSSRGAQDRRLHSICLTCRTLRAKPADVRLLSKLCTLCAELCVHSSMCTTGEAAGRPLPSVAVTRRRLH